MVIKKKSLIFLITFLLFIGLVFSNNAYSIKVGGRAMGGKIYGIILDADTNEPVVGAKVVPKVKMSRAGKTDKAGRFIVLGRVGSSYTKLKLGIPSPFGGMVKTVEVNTLPWEPIKFSVTKLGYKIYIDEVPRYYHRFSRGWGHARVYVYTMYLAKVGSDKKSEYAKDFFDKNFVFSDISIEPKVITKGNKVKIRCKFIMPPEETLTLKPQVRDLIKGKMYDLKKEEDKKTKKETGYYIAEIDVGGKPGLYPIESQVGGIILGGRKYLFPGDPTESRHKAVLHTFARSKKREYILRCKTKEQEEVSSLFFSCLEKINKDEILSAKEDIQKALNKAQDFAPYNWALSLAYQEEGDYLKAIESCKKAIELDKDFLPAYLQLGILYATQMDSPKHKIDFQKRAETQLDYISGKAYKDIELYTSIADAYFLAELYDKAKKMYEEILKIDKEDQDAQSWKEISENMAKVTKKEKDAGAWYEVGSSYVELSMYDKAIEAFKKAIDANPKYHQAFGDLGEVYVEKNRVDDAIDAFRKAIELTPKEVEYHFNLALAYKEKGEDEEALKEFDEVLKIKPKEEEYLFERAFCQARVNAAKSPNDAVANIEVAKYYFDDYDYDNTIKHCEKAIELGSKSGDAYGYLGLAYATLGKKDEALTNLEKGKSLEANNSKIRSGLATIYEDGGDYAKAKTEWEEVIKLEKGKKSTLEKTAKEHLDELKKIK